MNIPAFLARLLELAKKAVPIAKKLAPFIPTLMDWLKNLKKNPEQPAADSATVPTEAPKLLPSPFASLPDVSKMTEEISTDELITVSKRELCKELCKIYLRGRNDAIADFWKDI